ncbi:MAG TPA: deoxyribonuclease V [Anaerohalosphaeraceae bacterium]|jgi:deoxyribonuclease V|nr:deoxyribonuclease V [Anaerohalosphaeraceae bacterium]HRT49016.1 deoxyribonuclease V [Anaerohalosphaeraceae bacterium]HRT85139.1 deoxyribonuclease V [Anaerohalosphaeraceae bacterium]
MKLKHLHDWDLTYAAARALQAELAGKVRTRPLRCPPRTVAGIDCAFSRDKKRIGAIVVVLEYPTLQILETASAVQAVSFPYIPGLLSFREAPVCLAATAKLQKAPDCFLIDGQGVAHPRRLGLASHLGLLLDRPTVGCAKSRLIGTFDPPARKRGSHRPLLDDHETIGAVVRTRTDVKPVFVSIGHKCTLEDAIQITLACAPRYRLPEPTRLAHQHITRLKPEL